MMDLPKGKWRIRVERSFLQDRNVCMICYITDDGKQFVVTSLEFKNVDPAMLWPEDAPHALRHTDQFLQTMLDASWEAGLRPTGYAQIAEGLQSQDRHLQDMRQIVAKTLDVDLPTKK